MVDTSISGRRVVRELTELIARRSASKMIVSDNGNELTSNAVLAWSGDVGVRDELLNETLLFTIGHVTSCEDRFALG